MLLDGTSSETITEIGKALLKAQMKIKNPRKDKKNPRFHSEYTSLNSILEAVKPHLTENGIIVMQPIQCDPSLNRYLRTYLIHAATGEFISSIFHLRPMAGDPQAEGSAITYAKKYSICALLGIDGDDHDDDGNKGSDRTNKPAISPEEIIDAREKWLFKNDFSKSQVERIMKAVGDSSKEDFMAYAGNFDRSEV